MTSEIVNSIFFGLGIFLQAYFLIGFKKADLKEILKDIGGGFLFVFLLLYIFGKGIEQGEKFDPDFVIVSSVYAFCLGFGASFTLSFKKRILLQISEINLLVLNLILLYYCITRLGFDNWFTKIIYLPTITVLMLILFKSELKNIHKGFLYLWYVVLFIIIGVINIYQTQGDSGNIYLSYVLSFFQGGIFLYIWIYFVYLIMFTDIIDFFLDKRRLDVSRGRAAVKENFLYLAKSFNKTNIGNFKILMSFIGLLSFLIINYYNNYISENLLIVFILFIASVSSAKRADLTKKDIIKEN